jgi:hypothetical protein
VLILPSVGALGHLIAGRYEDWTGPRFLEEEVFGSGDPDRIAGCVDRFCARELGSSISRYELFATSVMSVHGVRLADGRRVVVKVARESLGAGFLSAVQTVQSQLASRGFPAPRPLLGPTAMEAGIAVVEELLDRGTAACAHDASTRRALADALARIVELCRGFEALPGLGPSLLASPARGELWPEPHDRRFDFVRTAAGAGWIDQLAARARERLAAANGAVVVAHSDWRTEHVRFDGEKIVASYDWQSLAVGPEPVLVGQAAHAFTADWSKPQQRQHPTLDESRAFVADYEAARGTRFPHAEREALDASWVYATAYGARCEHSDAQHGHPWAKPQASDDSYRGLLARHGEDLLT